MQNKSKRFHVARQLFAREELYITRGPINQMSDHTMLFYEHDSRKCLNRMLRDEWVYFIYCSIDSGEICGC